MSTFIWSPADRHPLNSAARLRINRVPCPRDLLKNGSRSPKLQLRQGMFNEFGLLTLKWGVSAVGSRVKAPFKVLLLPLCKIMSQ